MALTKPRIIELLLVTTVPAMILAAGGVPPLGKLAATLVGGTLAAGSANALNCYVDRDIDEVMRRTQRRPLPRRTVSTRGALVFAITLGAVATAVMAAGTTLLATALTVAAIVFYVCGYTLWLKRRTPQNIVWGGAAGCMPVLIGWSAVTGSLALAPVVLFLIVFFWTPPHFWALAQRFREDYAAAGVPMLPTVAGAERVGRQIVAYSWATAAASVALWPVATSWLYGASAVVLGAALLVRAHALHDRTRQGLPPESMGLFRWSTRYLALLFGALALDVLLLA
ncbi:MAG: protoheme IX farnesyltransferase [Gammaproteobacteria bacterium]|nr:protoheme IX farnesyltransferase [Gemmatimonadota bacterium]NIR40532.1 protoheme IX farnesyltransferase [Actinomycetota bacterium]NIU78671.1 protoheme IX farnesyltransferase [Gammaproteobacteria bacterium]